MKYRVNLSALIILLWSAAAALASVPQADLGAACVQCHSQVTPKIVTDWKASKHSEAGISCDACHGGDHTTATDFAKAKIPTPDTCGGCHETQVAQFKRGKHSMAWAAMGARRMLSGPLEECPQRDRLVVTLISGRKNQC